MKAVRQPAPLADRTGTRRDWPLAAEMASVRGAAPVAGASLNSGRAYAEPPVRPVPGWRLPSGQLLVEYALRAGLASSPLLVRLPLLGANAGGRVGGGSLSALSARVGAKPAAVRREPQSEAPGKGALRARA